MVLEEKYGKNFVSSNFIDGDVDIRWLPTRAQKEEREREDSQRERDRDALRRRNEERRAMHAARRGMEKKEQKEEKIEEEKLPKKLSYEQRRLLDLVKTMYIYKIFESQDFSEEDIFVCLAELGRALYPTKQARQECALYLRGPGGCGKSTLLKLMGEMFEHLDVGYLMADAQEQFPDEHFEKKRAVIAMDMERKCNLLPTRLCSYISKEKVSINRKFKEAIVKTWTAPLLIASNANPPWADKGGNILRRLIIMLFDRLPSESDSNLLKNCMTQLPMMMVVISQIFKEWLRILGSKGIWDNDEDGYPFLPERVWQARDEFMCQSNCVAAFLHDTDTIMKSPTGTMHLEKFNTLLISYQSAMNMKQKKNFNPIDDLAVLKGQGLGYNQKTKMFRGIFAIE